MYVVYVDCRSPYSNYESSNKCIEATYPTYLHPITQDPLHPVSPAAKEKGK